MIYNQNIRSFVLKLVAKEQRRIFWPKSLIFSTAKKLPKSYFFQVLCGILSPRAAALGYWRATRPGLNELPNFSGVQNIPQRFFFRCYFLLVLLNLILFINIKLQFFLSKSLYFFQVFQVFGKCLLFYSTRRGRFRPEYLPKQGGTFLYVKILRGHPYITSRNKKWKN